MNELHPIQEEDLVPSAKIVGALIATVALTVIALLWVWAVMRPFERADRGDRRTRGPGIAVRPPEVGGPTPVDRTIFGEGPGFSAREHGRKRQALERWGWVDRNAGTVRVPIERAMQMVVEENRR